MSIKHGDIVKHKRKDLRIKVSWADHSHLNGYDQNGHYHAGLRQDAFEPIEIWSDWERCENSLSHSQFWKGCEFEKRSTNSYVDGKWGGQIKLEYRIRLDNKPQPVRVSDLKGTVEMVDGKPDWSTYKES